VLFGSISLGYGDLFVAALLGAALAAQSRRAGPVALLTLVVAGGFDLLFFVLNELPATVPVALALIIAEVWVWVAARRRPARAVERPPAGAGAGAGAGSGSGSGAGGDRAAEAAAGG
jgi:hypothetical protein